MTKGAKTPWGGLPKAVLDTLLPKTQALRKTRPGTKRRHSTSSVTESVKSSKRLSAGKDLNCCDKCGHATNTASDNITTRKWLGKVNTEPNQWRRGMVVRVPHMVPTLGEVPNDECRVWSKNVGNICPKVRYAIVVAVYCTRMIVLPIFSAQGHGTSHKPAAYHVTAMSVLARPKPSVAQKVTDNVLYISGDWQPREGSHVNLNEPMSVQYAWPLECDDQLQPRSTALLQQRYRIAHNMAFVPLFAQESYFRSQLTREPILCPLPDGAPADEHYVSEPHRPSVASENENLLNNDLGYGLENVRHDSKADRVLMVWKPSLQHLLNSTTAFPYYSAAGLWEVDPTTALKGKDPGFDYYPYDHIKYKKSAAKKGSNNSSDQLSPRTVKLPNGRWQCLHDCADKEKCKHSCCKNGVKRKPRTVKQEGSASPFKTSGGRVKKISSNRSNKKSKSPMERNAVNVDTDSGRRKSQRLAKGKAGLASR